MKTYVIAPSWTLQAPKVNKAACAKNIIFKEWNHFSNITKLMLTASVKLNKIANTCARLKLFL
jgi:hypothetical protein